MSDDRFEKACEHFNQAEYFEAHEVWEELWNEAYGPRHAFLQCLIQVAVALHHARNENWNGAQKLCIRSLDYLEKGRAESDPVDLDALERNVIEFHSVIQQRMRGEEAELPFFKLPLKEK